MILRCAVNREKFGCLPHANGDDSRLIDKRMEDLAFAPHKWG